MKKRFNPVHDDELWQVFSQNGEPIAGHGETDSTFFTDQNLVSSNAHVWFWRENGTAHEILLQKRSMAVRRKPGYYHISAAGHVNIGELPIDAATRETKEEMGVSIDKDKLYFIHTTRSPNSLNDLKHVYIYQLYGDVQFSFDDGEVDLVEWYNLDKFRQMTENPEAYKLVDQGSVYFSALIAAISRQT